MQAPVISATYLAVLALIYAVLSIRVIRLRRGNRIAFGDGDNVALRGAIRGHSHFAEYVPIIVLMVAMLEMLGASGFQLHVLLGTLVVSRLLHPFGLHAWPGSTQFRVGRVLGMVLTAFVMIATALLLLRRTLL